MRMASLIGEEVGGTVGYRFRGEDVSGKRTRILVVTEGILVRRLQSDPSLEGVSCVVFDEYHERSVDADLCLALCREAQLALRPSLRLLIMSATLGGELTSEVSTLLGDCPALSSEGRCFPVDVVHVGKRPLALAASGRLFDLVGEVRDVVTTALGSSAVGDVLVFLPGEREIRAVEAELNAALPAAAAGRLRVLPLYGALPFEEQTEAIEDDPQGRRRVVLATSIAESSITIKGVRFVVDSGLRRSSTFDANTGMSSLVTRPIALSSAQQRAGRAGRVAPGTAYRLWTESEERRLPEQSLPEIAEADLAAPALQLATWGSITDDAVFALPWVTPPPAHALTRARQTLVRLGALSQTSLGEGGEGLMLARYGSVMSALPAHPRLAHALLAAAALERQPGNGSPSPVEVACALCVLVEEPDVLQGGARVHGADARKRLDAILSRAPPPDAMPGRWRRARDACKELKQRVARASKSREFEAEMLAVTAAATLGASGDVPQAVSAADLAAALANARGNGAAQPTAAAATGIGLASELAAASFVERVGQRQQGKENTFLLGNGRQASFAVSSEPLADADYIVAVALDGAEKKTARIQQALPISLASLRRAVPHLIRTAEEAFMAPSDGSLRRRRVERLESIVLSSVTLPPPRPGSEQARGLLLEALRERGIRRVLFAEGGGGAGGGPSKALELAARVRMMRALQPGRAWPLWTEAELLESAAGGWLASALSEAGGLKQLAKADVARLLEQSMPYELQTALRSDAPTKLEVPSGATLPLRYARDGADPLAELSEGEEPLAPVLACKLQEWFGASETPVVGPKGAQIPVLLHLLSPKGAPVAVTSDLPSFWAGSYAQVRAELRDKYKRHPWPEDPATAEPTRLTSRALAKQAANAASVEGGGAPARASGATPNGGSGKAKGGGGGAAKKKKGKATGGRPTTKSGKPIKNFRRS